MKFITRKTMTIRESGRSSDYITPSFGFGCLYKCEYCYMRRHLPNGLTISKNTKDNLKSTIPNLPSTYVKEQKVSILNSILVVLFVIIFISGFWIVRNLEINTLVLLKFYLNEFTFNLKLIFEDIANVIYQILN